MALCTAAEVRDVLGLASETALNTLLDTLIGRVGVIFAAWCGYPPASAGAAPTMESASYTVYTGDPGCRADGRDLHLSPYPITASLVVYDDPTEAFGTAVSSGDYAQRGPYGEVVRLTQTSTQGSWSSTDRYVKATYTGGWATVPAGLKAAAVEMAAHLYLLRNRRGLASEGAPDLQTSYRGDEIPAHVRQLLGPYRLASVLL